MAAARRATGIALSAGLGSALAAGVAPPDAPSLPVQAVQAIPAAPAAPEPAPQEHPAAALGCGGCHPGVPDGGVRARSPGLGPAAAPAAERVFAVLGSPDPGGGDPAAAHLPDFRLDEGERVSLALFLAGEPTGSGSWAPARARHRDLDAADGERVFRALNCAGCHDHPDVEPRRDAPDLSLEGRRVRAGWLREYLARPRPIRPTGAPAGTWSRMPDFHMDSARVEALVRAMGAGPGGPRGGPEPSPLTPHRRRMVERSLEGRLSCLGCHRLGGRGGRLGPPLDGVAARLTPAYLRRVVSDPGTVVGDPSMPPGSLAPGQGEVLARYLEGLGGTWTPAARPSLTDPEVEAAMAAAGPRGADRRADAATDAPDGAALYGRWCASCHGVQGRGDGWNAPNLPVAPTPHAEPALMERRPDDTLYDGIHAGAWVLDGSPAMPAFGGAFSPEEIRALVEHIRRLCRCRGPDWSRDGARRGAG